MSITVYRTATHPQHMEGVVIPACEQAGWREVFSSEEFDQLSSTVARLMDVNFLAADRVVDDLTAVMKPELRERIAAARYERLVVIR